MFRDNIGSLKDYVWYLKLLKKWLFVNTVLFIALDYLTFLYFFPTFIGQGSNQCENYYDSDTCYIYALKFIPFVIIYSVYQYYTAN